MANSKMFWKYGVVLACVIVLFVVSINLIMATVHNLITPIIEINKSIDTPYTSPNNLSLEELTQTEKMVEEKREKINTSLVLFRSSYSITTSPGIEQNIGYNNDYYLIQFYGDLASIDKETRDTLEQLGVTLFDYVPNNAFYAKIPLESFDRLGSLVKIKKIRYIGSIPEKAKIGSELLTKAQTNSSDTFRIVVHLFEDVSGEQLATLKRNMRVESFSDTTHFAYGSASGDNIVNICRLNFVKWVEEETPARVFNNDGTSAIAGDVVLDASSYTGSGIRVAVADTGIAQQGSTYHDDLPSSRVIDQHHFKHWWPDDDIAEDENGHGTHVAGTIGGSGSRNNRHRGMAPEASFLIYRMFNRDGNYESGQFDPCTERAAEHDTNVFSNSWGGGNGVYDSHSEIADNAVRGEYTDSYGNPQYMNVIIAAGNDNNYISAPGTAKNTITVGAAKEGNYPHWLCWTPCCDDDWPQGEYVCFSNYGPLDTDNDGNTRIKPDVIAPGVRITSTVPWYDCKLEEEGIINLGDYYGTLDGTSMATPHVSGAVALLLQAYPDVKDWPEMVKAQLINTAVDTGNPQSRQGHGMIDTYHMIYNDETFKTLKWIGSYLDDSITQREYYFDVPSGFKEVRVTLTWPDPAGSVELTNDLDFGVYDGNGNYVGGSYSSDDNVENRKFTTGASGTWKVVVHKFTLNDFPQHFGLVAGAVTSNPSLSLSASSDKTCVSPGDTFKITTEVSNSGYTSAGTYISMNVPDGLSLQSADMYRADGTKFNYELDNAPHWGVYHVGSTYYLAVGELIKGYPRKVDWNLKANADLQEGSHTFVIEANARNAGSQSKDIIIYYSESLPDLTVTSVNAPTSGEPGGYIAVSWTVKNQGNAASGSFYNRISLATAPYWTNISLGNYPMDSIAADSSSSDSQNPKIPEDVTPGYYYVTVYADTFKTIIESDEDNNINKAPQQIYISSTPPPNLPPSYSNPSVSPSSGTASMLFDYSIDVSDPEGDTVTVTLKTYDPSDGNWENQGDRNVAGSGTASWSDLTPFEVNDEGKTAKYKFEFDDGNNSGEWGPFNGPTIISEESDFTNWDYPSTSPPDEKIPVEVDISNPNGIKSAELHYDYGDDGSEDGSIQMSLIGVLSAKENLMPIETGGGGGLGIKVQKISVSESALSPGGGGLGAVKGIAIQSIYLCDAKTCKDVQASSPYDPIGVTTVFSPTDSISYTWLHFKDIWSSHTVKWKWYDPDGNFYTDCTYTISNPSDYGYDYWEWYKCWCGIYIKGYSAAEKEGIWTVKVYLDGDHIETLNFNIEYIISDHTMCKNVQESSPYEPIDRTSTFLSGDEKAVSWLRLDDVTNSLNVEWKWYDPSGSLYTTGEYTIPNPSGDYWDWYKCWCWIYIKDHAAAEKPGEWKVKVYIDDEYKFEGVFTIYPSSGRYKAEIPAPGIDYVGDEVSFYVRAYDAYNSPTDSTEHIVDIIDTITPDTEITSGPSGTINYNDMTFEWTGSDDVTPTSDLVYSCKLEGYDTSWSSWTSSTSKSYTDLSDGEYKFMVKAKDQAENIDPSPAERSFIVDTIPPLAPIDIFATPITWTSTNSFSVSWTNPSDVSGIAGAYYKLDSVPTSDTDGTWTTSKPIPNIAVSGDGSHPIYIWLKDNAGNVDYNNRGSTTLYYDGTPPNAPTNMIWDDGSYSTDATIIANWSSVIDISGITDYYLQVDVDSTDFSSGMIFDGFIGSPTSSKTLTSKNDVADGHTYYYRVKAKNGAGSLGSSWSSVSDGVIVDTTPPASITNLSSTTGQTWINWTWVNPADTDFNHTMVYIDGTFEKNVSAPYYNDTYTAHATKTISTHTVDASGNINSTWVNQTTTIPNNAPVLDPIGDKTVDENEKLAIDADATDLDSDSLTYSCNRTDLFTDFNSATGEGNWTPSSGQTGIYYVDFGVSDGYGGVDNESVRITVNDVTPPASITNLQNVTGNFWINWTWTNPLDSDFNYTMVYLNGTWRANTSYPFYNATTLNPDTYYEIGAHTVDKVGNINGTWVNQTTKTQALPDLVINDIRVNWPENCTICYNVTNTGNGTASAGHNTTLYVDTNEVAHDHISVDLKPGESYIGCFNYTWTYTPPDDNITVCADNNNIVAESNETNNCFTNMWKCGDVNMDGEVTIGDVRKVWNRYLDPNYALELPWAADVNCDGAITIGDVRKVWNRYLDPGYELNCCCGTDLFFYKNIHGERRR